MIYILKPDDELPWGAPTKLRGKMIAVAPDKLYQKSYRGTPLEFYEDSEFPMICLRELKGNFLDAVSYFEGTMFVPLHLLDEVTVDYQEFFDAL